MNPYIHFLVSIVTTIPKEHPELICIAVSFDRNNQAGFNEDVTQFEFREDSAREFWLDRADVQSHRDHCFIADVKRIEGVVQEPIVGK